MDVKLVNDVQKQIFQRLIEKLLLHNKFTAKEAENLRKLLENVRDTKNFDKIMEKLKECGQFELDTIEDNFKEGNCLDLHVNTVRKKEELRPDGSASLHLFPTFFFLLFTSLIS
jgi:hypothetical protein